MALCGILRTSFCPINVQYYPWEHNNKTVNPVIDIE